MSTCNSSKSGESSRRTHIFTMEECLFEETGYSINLLIIISQGLNFINKICITKICLIYDGKS